jgi:hypothetical protein
MPRGLHFGRGLLKGLGDIADVVEAFAPLFEPVGVDALTVERFDQLILGAAAVERESERPFGWPAAVLAALSLRAEDPAARRSGCEPRVDLTRGERDVPDDERDLERRESFEGWHERHAAEFSWLHALVEAL